MSYDVKRDTLGWLVVNRVNQRRKTKYCVLCCPVPDHGTDLLRSLANDMTLAPSNDVADTIDWLREHVAHVGLAAAVAWYAQCGVSRTADPFVKRLDWKAGIIASKHRG